MLSKTLQNFLEKNKLKAEVIEHRTVYTAFDKSATLKIKPAMVGKTIVISFDGKDHAIGLIPANKNLDKKKVMAVFNKLRQKAKEKNYKKIDFAKEQWIKNNIKGVDLGAAPPLGLLYKLTFFIDNSLLKHSKIIVNGGKYETSLKLTPSVLLKLDPKTIKGGFSMPKK